jgi:hypothetical protein
MGTRRKAGVFFTGFHAPFTGISEAFTDNEFEKRQ